jgi:hypothetical protein
MSEQTELEKRIKQLEEENARLKSKGAKPTEFSAREDSYEGHPTLVFEGPLMRKTFTLGLAKLRTIRACWRQIETFLSKHSSEEDSNQI